MDRRASRNLEYSGGAATADELRQWMRMAEVLGSSTLDGEPLTATGERSSGGCRGCGGGGRGGGGGVREEVFVGRVVEIVFGVKTNLDVVEAVLAHLRVAFVRRRSSELLAVRLILPGRRGGAQASQGLLHVIVFDNSLAVFVVHCACTSFRRRPSSAKPRKKERKWERERKREREREGERGRNERDRERVKKGRSERGGRKRSTLQRRARSKARHTGRCTDRKVSSVALIRFDH